MSAGAIADPVIPAPLERHSPFVWDGPEPDSRAHQGPFLIGVLKGEGVGPVLVEAALNLLGVFVESGGHHFEIEYGGPIGLEAQRSDGSALTGDVIDFCSSVFSRGGAILAGPGGGRFVYDLRRRFDLFCKLSPIARVPRRAEPARSDRMSCRGSTSWSSARTVRAFIRDHGVARVLKAGAASSGIHSRILNLKCARILRVACQIAGRRRGELAVVIKDGGIPGMSDLWRCCTVEVAGELGVAHKFLDIDCAAYKLIRNPHEFDVIATPNLFGDVLGDLGGVLVGSRGMTYSGNFAADGSAVFQTNHGSAYDLVGTDLANPAGQILSLAFLMRERFGLVHEAQLVEDALAQVWSQGWRTPDLMEPGCRQIGTTGMAELVALALSRLISLGWRSAMASAIAVSGGSASITAEAEARRLPAAIVAGERIPGTGAGGSDFFHCSPRRPREVLWRVPACNRETTARAGQRGARRSRGLGRDRDF